MKSILKAVALGAALTAFSLVHGWMGIDSMFRGFPFWFMNVIPGYTYANSAGPGTDVWFFRGYGPLIANWFIWTFLAWACLRLLKGTASALFAVAAIWCVWGFLYWRRCHDYFGWSDWLLVVLSVGIYLLLGIHARRSRLAAAFIGAGLYASLVTFQAFQSVDQLMGGLIFKMPIAVLLLLAVMFAMKRNHTNQIDHGNGNSSRSDG
jgi:hypothetical protein